MSERAKVVELLQETLKACPPGLHVSKGQVYRKKMTLVLEFEPQESAPVAAFEYVSALVAFAPVLLDEAPGALRKGGSDE